MTSRDTADTPVIPAPGPAIRFGWVEYARGIAIVLVVYRHCLVGMQRAGVVVASQAYAVQEFLYNVRMPVFFVLSGIFLQVSLRKSSQQLLIRKKAATLLYPYILWSVFLISLQWVFSAYTNSSRTARDFLYILLQPRELDHMWYLLALFNTSVLFLLLNPLLTRYKSIHIGLALLLHFASFYLAPWSFFSDIAYHYIFLVAGAFISGQVSKWESLSTSGTALILLLVAPFFIAGQLYWLRNIGENYQSAHWWDLGPYLLIIFIACFVFYLVSRLLEAWGRMRWLQKLGKHSLYIYILHIHIIAFVRILFVKVLKIREWEYVLPVSVVLALVLPVYIFSIIKKYNGQFLFSFPQKTK